jgi:hypothetical protein
VLVSSPHYGSAVLTEFNFSHTPIPVASDSCPFALMGIAQESLLILERLLKTTFIQSIEPGGTFQPIIASSAEIHNSQDPPLKDFFVVGTKCSGVAVE